MRKLHRQFRFVDEHAHELGIVGDARKNAFDRHQSLDAVHADGLGQVHFGHAANVQAAQK